MFFCCCGYSTYNCSIKQRGRGRTEATGYEMVMPGWQRKKYKKQKEHFLQMYKRKKVVKVIYTHSIITVLCQNSSILMLGLKEQSCSFTSVHAVQ